MIAEKINILAVLLEVKRENGLDVDDQLIMDCYEVQKRHQFNPDRNTKNLMGDLIETSLTRAEVQ